MRWQAAKVTHWKTFFIARGNNYEIAARLKDPNDPSTNKELRTVLQPEARKHDR